MWHFLSAEEVARRLETDSERGLSGELAHSRLETNGPNETESHQRRTLAAIVFSQFADLMIVILLAAAVISAFIGEPGDTLTIVVIVVLNAVIGSVQEFRAQRALAALGDIAAPTATVVRDGVAVEIDSRCVVPGDRVLLQAGDVVPADLRLIATTEMQTDESTLTGESVSVEKFTGRLESEVLPVADRRNMAFKSTSVTKGRGAGLVVATGADTEIGRIALLLSRRRRPRTPLQQRLASFSRRLALVVLAVCGAIFVLGVAGGEPPSLMFFIAVSLAVAAVPEALPAVVTISLALGARMLSRKHSLIRRLAAVEALGSVTYICADKTGTLTENRMRVAWFRAGGVHGEALEDIEPAIAARLGRAMALCNDVGDSGDADQTELALIESARAAGYDADDLVRAEPLAQMFPFDSELKLMTTVHRGDGVRVAYVKGAPEQVLERSLSVDRDLLHAEADALAREGYRVLAFARRELADGVDALSREDVERNLEFLGFAALHDPIRAEVPRAIDSCRQAGISVVMITGDHPGTARHIAESVGLLGSGSELLTGSELAKLSDRELAERVGRVGVYARVDPAQKIRIVEALQQRGEHVAMTGDGVNDAPALRQATIGVAIGGRGTDVAREAADLVLLDDNFATIVTAIREGRRVYDNIRKFIRYTMTSNTGEISVLVGASFAGLPIPLLPVHILWINLVTDGLPGLAFSAEPAGQDVMRRLPRSPSERIFSHGLWKHMLWIGALLATVALAHAAWIDAADQGRWQTMVFTTLVMSQLLQAFALRSETRSVFEIGWLSNRYMTMTVAGSILLQLAVVYLPFFNVALHTVPLSIRDLALCLVLSLVVPSAIELEKLLLRRRDRVRVSDV